MSGRGSRRYGWHISRVIGLLAAAMGMAAGIVVSAGPAAAAVPDTWAFAYLDDPNPPQNYVVDPARQAGTFQTACPGTQATVVTGGIGVYKIIFPCSAAAAGVAHVTAVDPHGSFCELGDWFAAGTDENVEVFCFDAAGVPANTRFSVVFMTSSGGSGPGPHAYLHADGSGTVLTSYHTAGGPIGVTRIGPGAYEIRLDAWGQTVVAGNLQATAVDGSQVPRHCKVGIWSVGRGTYTLYVFCHDAAGVRADSEFTLSYHHKRTVFGANSPPTAVAYILGLGTSPDTDVNSAGGPNRLTPFAVGRWTLVYPGVAGAQTHMQVTAYGSSPQYCQLYRVWWVAGTDIMTNIACFNIGGAYAHTPFLATYAPNA